MTTITRDQAMSIVSASGVPYVDQSAWTKVGTGSHRVYVSRAKRATPRVFLAGARFAELEGVRPLPEDERFCSVTAELPLADEASLAVLEACLFLAATMGDKPKKPAPEPKARKARAAKAKAEAEAPKPPRVLSPEQQAERKAKIEAMVKARREATKKDAPKPEAQEAAASSPSTGDETAHIRAELA